MKSQTTVRHSFLVEGFSSRSLVTQRIGILGLIMSAQPRPRPKPKMRTAATTASSSQTPSSDPASLSAFAPASSDTYDMFNRNRSNEAKLRAQREYYLPLIERVGRAKWRRPFDQDDA